MRKFEADPPSAANPDPTFLLSARELDIIALRARGLEYKEIAARLNISPRTVSNHLAHVGEKLGVNNTTEVMKKLFPRGH